MSAVEERICDRKVLKLLRAMLRSGVMEDRTVRHAVTGTPQGGVVSPLLCNVYLNRLDRAWETEGSGTLVRYADDLVAMCRSRSEAERALAQLRSMLAELGLEPKEAKTRTVHLEVGGEGFETANDLILSKRRAEFPILKNAAQPRRNLLRLLTTSSTGTSSLDRSVSSRIHGWRSSWPSCTAAALATDGSSCVMRTASA